MTRWRTPLLWLLTFLLAAVFVARCGDLRGLERVAAQASPLWLLAALALQVAHNLAYAALFRSAFAAAGERRALGELLPLWLATRALNLIAPTISQGLLVRSPRSAAGLLLAKALDYTTLALPLGVALLYLHRCGKLAAWEGLGALGWAGLTAALWLALALGRRGEKLLNRFGLGAAVDGLAGLWTRRRDLAAALGLALLAHAADLATIGALFLAARTPVEPGALVAGFSIGVVFWLVSVTPEGIGAVEGVMSLVYGALGVPAASAAAVVLLFRALTLYLPVLIGLAFVRRLLPGKRSASCPA